ncbi:MAG: DUF5131 family protein [Planctomycetaceae bacterium]|nr:DUF5131 family protein [Planctomycetaceae bacterium]
MAENSKIGWTDHTHNFWWGCNKVSEECRFCYIDGIMRRGGHEPFQGPVRTKNWRKPFSWNKVAAESDCRFKIFTCSMSDFFHPGADEWREEAWEVIRSCEMLDWLILTKRPEMIQDRLPDDWDEGYPNVWLGTTAGCADSFERIETLLPIPAAIHFVSAEPLLEQLDLRPYLWGLDWVITGCERAKKGKRRIMELDWVRDIDQQCRAADVAHFFKQYYQDDVGVPQEDGKIDGVIRQDCPTSGALVTC